MRGKSTEPVKLRPGIEVRDAAHSIEIEQWAWQRVQSMRAFYTHLMIYCVVNFALLIIDLASPGDPWFFYPLLGWGLGLGIHAAQTFERLPWFTRDWEQRKVQELIEEKIARPPQA